MELKKDNFIKNIPGKVAELFDHENMRRWDIVKVNDGRYYVQYWEYLKMFDSWEYYIDTSNEFWSKEAIEFEFDIKL